METIYARHRQTTGADRTSQCRPPDSADRVIRVILVIRVIRVILVILVILVMSIEHTTKQ